MEDAATVIHGNIRLKPEEGPVGVLPCPCDPACQLGPRRSGELTWGIRVKIDVLMTENPGRFNTEGDINWSSLQRAAGSQASHVRRQARIHVEKYHQQGHPIPKSIEMKVARPRIKVRNACA